MSCFDHNHWTKTPVCQAGVRLYLLEQALWCYSQGMHALVQQI